MIIHDKYYNYYDNYIMSILYDTYAVIIMNTIASCELQSYCIFVRFVFYDFHSRIRRGED